MGVSLLLAVVRNEWEMGNERHCVLILNADRTSVLDSFQTCGCFALL